MHTVAISLHPWIIYPLLVQASTLVRKCHICDWTKLSQIEQNLKYNLLLNIKPTLLHYPETPNTWIEMAKSAFTDGFFPTLSNRQGALQGLWSQ